MADTKQATAKAVCECVGGFVERGGTGIWRNHCAVCGMKRAKSCSCGTGDACDICGGVSQPSQTELRIPDDLTGRYTELTVWIKGPCPYDTEMPENLSLSDELALIERIARLEGGR